jgi:phosphatidylglycerol---prolipoprotein diacylglyceryl transferase
VGGIIYSLFQVLAYSAAFGIFYYEARRKGYPLEKLLYVLLGTLAGALIGSRLGSLLFVYRDYFFHNPGIILNPVSGGKTLVGGLIGGYIGAEVTKKALKFSRSTGDLFAPGAALGIAIGRWGCFFNGCCYGKETALPWAVGFHGRLRHPTQVYESLFCLGLFILLWRLRTKLNREGDLFKMFLLAYVLWRFAIEFLRADRVPGIWGLSIAQLISAAVFMVLAGYFMRKPAKEDNGKQDLH